MDLAGLLDSPAMEVSQQAARSLRNLGRVSAPAANRLAEHVSNPNHNTLTWLAVNALGACGAAAEAHIPLLQSLDGLEPPMFRGAVADAIKAIERDVAQRSRLDRKHGVTPR
jgi:hypothetical protein